MAYCEMALELIHKKRKKQPDYFASKEKQLQGLDTKEFVDFLSRTNNETHTTESMFRPRTYWDKKRMSVGKLKYNTS